MKVRATPGVLCTTKQGKPEARAGQRVIRRVPDLVVALKLMWLVDPQKHTHTHTHTWFQGQEAMKESTFFQQKQYLGQRAKPRRQVENRNYKPRPDTKMSHQGHPVLPHTHLMLCGAQSLRVVLLSLQTGFLYIQVYSYHLQESQRDELKVKCERLRKVTQ